MQLQQHNDTWALCSSDGIVEFRDRNFDILPMDESPDRLSTLSQLGFTLTNQKPCKFCRLNDARKLIFKAFTSHCLQMVL